MAEARIGCIAIIKWIWTQVKRRFSYMVENSQDNQVLVDMDASASLPSSSSPVEWKYDVFLSFRGSDTRKGITVDIYDGLNRGGIKAFMDDPDLVVGDSISPTLIAAIKGSRYAIVVLSQNYASSAWCLEELREICLSMEDNRILPLFYHVDPTDVRYQKKGSFKEAFYKHETSGQHRMEKVKEWKAALNKVANISGWNTTDHKTERALTEAIVKLLSSKIVPDAIESTRDFQAFEATRIAMDEVMKALKDDEVTAVGVYGMGGVGKTTLVEHVGAHARKSGIFDHVIMGVLSQTPDLAKIQGTLSELLSFKFEEDTEIGRAARLSKEIRRRQRILIILDDIWERTELSRIGIPSYKELQNCNSKILLTTRIRNVCHAMECQRKIILNVLSEQDSWVLFVRKARRYFESPTFEGVAKKVAGECRGLPIALITVARALGDKDLVDWRRAAQRLEKSQTANPDDKGEASKCIKLSYDYLEDEDYRSYFLLCCLFPEDYDIPIEDLFRYGIRTRLFRDAETLMEAREQADSVIKHLKYSCLLLDSEEDRCVRMHDVVRDAAIQIVQSEDEFFVKAGCGLEDLPRKLHKGYLAISLMRNYISKLPKNLVCPKLQILLLNRNFSLENIPETFFQCPNELRVLDLSLTSLSLLPKSFGVLTNLTALYLDDCTHLRIDTSILGKLKKLEILSMRNSRLYELSVEIGGLTNLRMLDITGEHISRIPSKLISKLHDLEELYMQGFWEWERLWPYRRGEVNDTFTNASFDEVTSLSKLRVLKVSMLDVECIPKYVESIPDWVEFHIRIGKYDPIKIPSHDEYDRYGHINSICLKLDIISRLPDWFRNEIMKKTEHLVWEEGRRLIDIFVESEHGRLEELKQLEIVGPESIMEPTNTITWVPEKPVFENLEALHLLELDCAELCALEVLPPGSFFNLKLLKVETCYNWGNILLPSTLLQRLLNLEELYCKTMYQSEYVFGFEEASHIVSKQLKLRKIELSDTDIVSLCDGPAPPAMFQNLQSFSITNCMLLGSLFTYDVAQCLSQLNCLVLEGCLYLEKIVEANNEKIILPKLEKLSLIELPMLDYESATFDIQCPSLEYLELCDCPKFSVSSSDFHSWKQVQVKLNRSYRL
uniref:probable disease resistance protein At4g27220 isoform X1 n=1 Tax=Fragaria vesca subsp. vesca TaxID=101020 RepID=UPI0005C9E1AB|nr:PREDICTED: probable disease resistance protein At4g27220 isoform X1 [Fragaria vesca subsp. vesca]